jgi:glycosyltransferase involved in cell wall biosynthesis
MAENKKILSIASTYPRWSGDTVPPFVLYLNSYLQKEGYTVYALAPHYPGAKFYEVLEGVRTYRFPYFFPLRFQRLCYEGGIMANVRSSVLAKIQIPSFLFMELVYTAYLALRLSPSVIHAHWIIPQGLVASIVSRLFNIPLVVTIHGSDVFIFNKGIPSKVAKYTIRGSDALTVNSTASLKALSIIEPRVRAQIIPMGIDLDKFSPLKKCDSIKAKLNIEGALLLSVGRLVPLKGFAYVVSAMPTILKNYPTTKLIVIGDGPERKQLQKLAVELEVQENVIFLGNLPNNQLPEYYSSASIYIGPSIHTDDGAQEAFGIVFLEALASGLPVISTGIGGITDIVQNEVTGLVVPEQDSESIANSVLRLIRDQKLNSLIVKNGLTAVHATYTWQHTAKSFGQIYKALNSRIS